MSTRTFITDFIRSLFRFGSSTFSFSFIWRSFCCSFQRSKNVQNVRWCSSRWHRCQMRMEWSWQRVKWRRKPSWKSNWNFSFSFVMFKNYRIPRENLLNKHGDVLPDGTYQTPFKVFPSISNVRSRRKFEFLDVEQTFWRESRRSFIGSSRYQFVGNRHVDQLLYNCHSIFLCSKTIRSVCWHRNSGHRISNSSSRRFVVHRNEFDQRFFRFFH